MGEELMTQAPPTGLPSFLNQKQEVTKASEKIEMQRATAEVMAAHQRAIQFPRDEARCVQKIMHLCENIQFASDAISAKPNRGEVLKVQTMKTLALIWGNMDSGSTNHGAYGDESQCESWAIDLESNFRRVSRYTVSHKYKAKDEIKIKTDPEDISDHVKAHQSKHERNCIKSVIPDWLYDQVLITCKRTMHSEVRNVNDSWIGWSKLYQEIGVEPLSLLRYCNKKESKELTAADIVTLRILYGDAKDDIELLQDAFPERDKSKTAKAEAAQAEKKAAATELPKPNKQQQKKEEKKEAPAAAPPAQSTPQEAVNTAPNAEEPNTAQKDPAAEPKKSEEIQSQEPASAAEPEATEAQPTAETSQNETGTNDGSTVQAESSSAAPSNTATEILPARKKVNLAFS